MRIKKYNIGVFGANPYSANLGVGALAYSILFILNKVSTSKGVVFNYHFFNNKGKRQDSLSIGCADIQITNYDYSLGSSTLKEQIKFCIKHPQGILSALKFDAVVDIGEGDSFSDIYGKARFEKINATKKNLRFLGKKIILLPQTIGPFKNIEIKEEARISINDALLVTTRDKQSFDLVKEMVPGKKVFELVDLAFFLPFTKEEKQNNQKIRVGINVSGLLWNGGYTKNNQFQLKCDYEVLIKKTIEYFLSNKEVQVELVGHVITDGDNDYDNIENDLKTCDHLHQLYPDTKVAPAFKTPIEAKSYINGFDFFTGARMHACIAAFSSGVPVFPLAYSRKFNGLFGDTLNYSHFGDLVNTELDTVLAGLQLAFEKRQSLKQVITTTQNSLAQKESTLINLLINAIIPGKSV